MFSASQPSPRRIVHGMMFVRPLLLLGLAATMAGTACSRPVLYYPPGTEPPPSAPQPVLAGAPASTPVVAAPIATARAAEYLTQRHILLPVAGADMAKVDDSFYEDRD